MNHIYQVPGVPSTRTFFSVYATHNTVAPSRFLSRSGYERERDRATVVRVACFEKKGGVFGTPSTYYL